MLVTDVREELGRELEKQFAVVRTHAGWPDPWPDREVPQEAYSRVTEPERWLLGPERGEAWARALIVLGLGTRTDEPGSTRLVPTGPGAVPVSLLPHLPPQGARDRTAALEIRVGDRGVVALAPDCHCDACDSGSDDLLRQVDDTMWHVIDGGFVHVDLGGGAAVTTHRDGWSCSRVLGRETPDRLIADARAGRSRYPVVTGAAWW